MDYTNDLSGIQWIKDSISTQDSKEPLEVKHLLPGIYSAYTALLPTVGVIKDFPFDKVNTDSMAIEQMNINSQVWTQYGINSFNTKPTYEKTTFLDLATQFDCPYNLTLNNSLPWGKQGFATSGDCTLKVLKELLSQLGPSSKLNLYIEDYWRWDQVYNLLPTSEEVIYKVSIEEFCQFLDNAFFDASLFIFPDDRGWCLVNVEDLLCPIIGTNAVAENIIVESAIEKMKLNLEDIIWM